MSTPRIAAVLTALVVLGGAAGFGAATAFGGDDAPTLVSEATPLPAEPAVPAAPTPAEAPPEPYAEDIDYPTLVPPTRFARLTMGNDIQTWSYLAPRGWTAYDVTDDSVIAADEVADRQEVRFRPSDEPTEAGYSLRVKAVDDHVPPASMVTAKRLALRDLEDLEDLEQTEDSLYFTYRTGESRLRYNFFRWFAAPDSGEATLEMSVVGRKEDDVGLRGLFDQFRAGLRPVE